MQPRQHKLKLLHAQGLTLIFQSVMLVRVDWTLFRGWLHARILHTEMYTLDFEGHPPNGDATKPCPMLYP